MSEISVIDVPNSPAPIHDVLSSRSLSFNPSQIRPSRSVLAKRNLQRRQPLGEAYSLPICTGPSKAAISSKLSILVIPEEAPLDYYPSRNDTNGQPLCPIGHLLYNHPRDYSVPIKDIGAANNSTVVLEANTLNSNESYLNHALLGCFSFWFCGMLFGGIAFFLAILANGKKSTNPPLSRRLGQASLALSMASIVIGSLLAISVGLGVSQSAVTPISNSTFNSSSNS